MNMTRSLPYWLSLCLLLGPALAQGQVLLSDVAAQETNHAPEAQTTPRQKLSPGAEEVARELGLIPLIERLSSLPASDRGGAMNLEALSLRQEIMEAVLTTSLEVDGVIAEIDNEIAKISEIRAELESRRDHALQINAIANILTSGLSGVVGTALQFKQSTSNLGNAIGVAGAGVSTVLSIIGLRQQHGGKRALGVAPNMLAKLFDRETAFHSDYPEEVWTYLNAVPPTGTGTQTRRERLVKQWADFGRLDQAETPKGRHKIELLISSISQQRQLTIDQLSDRAAMLADVRAQVSLMKRDLSKLMLALRTR